MTILIVGAGVSGLTAAWHLQRRGVPVAVLEARAQTGGRLRHPEGASVDLGASWVWDTERNVHALLRELGLETFPHHADGVDTYDDGHALQRGRLPRSVVPERRIVGGAHGLAQALTQRLQDVRTGVVVRRIVARERGVAVHTESEVLHADHVLVGLPPALLAATIELPDLTSEDRAFLARTPTWMADVAKVVVSYEHPFWRDRGLSGRAASRVGPLVEIHDLSGPGSSKPALFGFVPRALAEDGWTERILPQLARLFGPEATEALAMHAQAWWTEAWLWSAASPEPAPGQMGHPRLRESRLHGRMHLISTETSGLSPGHIEGAVERAQSVAAAITR